MSLQEPCGFRQLKSAALRFHMSVSSLAAVFLVTGALVAPNAHAENRANIDRGGVIFAMTIAAIGNEILVYRRNPGGRLTPVRGATTPTGGSGASMNAAIAHLGSQTALVFVAAFDPPQAGQLPSTASVGTGQAATRWIVVSDSRFAYVSNTGSDTLSQFAYTRTGMLTLVDQIAAVPGCRASLLVISNRG
jgi:hypothetical protein